MADITAYGIPFPLGVSGTVLESAGPGNLPYWGSAGGGGDLEGDAQGPPQANVIGQIQGYAVGLANSEGGSGPEAGFVLYYNGTQFITAPPAGDLSGSWPNPTVAAIDGVALVDGVIQLASLPVSVATTLRVGSGAPTVLTTDQGGDSYFDYTNTVLYAGLSASPTVGQPWTSGGNSVDAQDTLLTTSTGLVNPMTNPGDMIRGGTSGAATRLGIGSNGQVLFVSSGEPVWASIFSAAGQLLIGQSGGTGTQLNIGTAYQELTVNSGATSPQWSSGVLATVTTAGDLTYANAAHAISRLGIGTAYQELTVNSGATAPQWSSGVLATVTTAGDLVYATGANAIARLGIGSGIQTLGIAAGVPAWVNVPTVNAQLSGAVTMAGSTATNIMTSPSLAVGTWELVWNFVLTAPASTSLTGLEVYHSGGTATYTTQGPQATEVAFQIASADIGFTWTARVVVTVAGTVTLVGYNNDTSSFTIHTGTQGTAAKANASGMFGRQIA
jgi:hypothetical protein